MMIKSKITKKVFKILFAIPIGDAFYDAVTSDMMLNKFQKTIEIVLALNSQNIIFHRKLLIFHQFLTLIAKKARRNFIQDPRSKDHNQKRIQAYKLFPPSDNIACRNVKSSKTQLYTLRNLFGLQRTNTISPKTTPKQSLSFRYLITKKTNVLQDSLSASKTLGPSKIPAWTKKMLNQY